MAMDTILITPIFNCSWFGQSYIRLNNVHPRNVFNYNYETELVMYKLIMPHELSFKLLFVLKNRSSEIKTNRDIHVRVFFECNNGKLWAQ